MAAIGSMVALNGCNLLAWPAYVLTPAKRFKTIQAEFDGLEDKKVAVVIVADEKLIYKHMYLRTQLGGIISAELRKSDNNLGDITTVSPT